MRIVPDINKSNIFSMINNCMYLSDLQKEFYTKYIDSRFNKLIIPAYECVLALKHSLKAEETDFDMTME